MGTRPWTRTNKKGLRHVQPHHEQPRRPDSPQNEATLGTRVSKPHILHPNEDNGSESGDVNRQTIGDEGAGQGIQRAQRDEQCTYQPENRSSSQCREESKTEGEATEVSTKMLEEKGDAIVLPAPLSSTPAEIPRGVGIKEAIPPIDEDWVTVEGAINPGAPLLGRTSSGAVGEPRSRFFLYLLSHIMEFAPLASSPTRCPDPIVQAHRAQDLSLSSKHVGSGEHVSSGGTHPGGTDQGNASQEVGAYTAHNTLADVVEYRNLRKPSGEHSVVNHVASNSSSVPRVMDEIATRLKGAHEPRFASLHSMGNTPGPQQQKYSDKPNAESGSRLARARLLFPGESFPSEE